MGKATGFYTYLWIQYANPELPIHSISMYRYSVTGSYPAVDVQMYMVYLFLTFDSDMTERLN